MLRRVAADMSVPVRDSAGSVGVAGSVDIELREDVDVGDCTMVSAAGTVLERGLGLGARGGGGPAACRRAERLKEASALSSRLKRRLARLASPGPLELADGARRSERGGVPASAMLPPPMLNAVPVLAELLTDECDDTGARSRSAGTFSPRYRCSLAICRRGAGIGVGVGEAGGVRPVLEEAEVEETEERRVDAEEIGGGESVSDGVGADADSGDGAMGGSGSAAGTMRRVG